METGNYWAPIYFKETNVIPGTIFQNGQDVFENTHKVCKRNIDENYPKIYGSVSGSTFQYGQINA